VLSPLRANSFCADFWANFRHKSAITETGFPLKSKGNKDCLSERLVKEKCLLGEIEFVLGFGVENESQGVCKENLCEMQGCASQGYCSRDLQR
jgi:hypothetical protein